jgi:hypothetical protein
MSLDAPDLSQFRDALDSSFGEGPPLPAPADRLADGRRHLRLRRRLAAAGSAAAVAPVLVGGGAALTGSGTVETRDEDPAATPPAVAPDTVTETVPSADPYSPLVEVTAADEVRAAPGWTLDQVEPIRVRVAGGPTPPGERIVQVSRDGEVRYVVVNGHGPEAERITVEGKVPPTSMLGALLTYLTQPGGSGEGAP